jgi:hypothetical protein
MSKEVDVGNINVQTVVMERNSLLGRNACKQLPNTQIKFKQVKIDIEPDKCKEKKLV